MLMYNRDLNKHSYSWEPAVKMTGAATVYQAKNVLRKQLKQQLASMTEHSRREQSHHITEKVGRPI